MPRRPVRGWTAAPPRRGNGTSGVVTDSRSLSPRGRMTPPLPEPPSRTSPYKPALIFALTYCVGHSVSTVNGDCIEGILHTPGLVQSEVHFVLKKARKLDKDGGERDFIERLVIPSSEVVQLFAKDLPIHSEPSQCPSSSPVLTLPIKSAPPENVVYRFGDFDDIGFLGDKDQERLGAGLYGRELKKWEPAEDEAAFLEFDDTNHEVGTWDQFAANERKFGVKTDFNMDIYTTPLEPEKSRYTIAQAESLARAIQSASSPNLHLQDERGQLTLDDSGISEEMLYSSVLTGQPKSKSETNAETPKKSDVTAEGEELLKENPPSPKSPESTKKTAPIPLILPKNSSHAMIIANRGHASKTIDARSEFNRVRLQLSSAKGIPHGSPLETSPLIQDMERLRALDLTPGTGRKNIQPADRDRFRKFKEEVVKLRQRSDEGFAKFRPFPQVKEQRAGSKQTVVSEDESPSLTQGTVAPSLDRCTAFGSQIIRDEETDLTVEEKSEETFPDVKTQRELPPLKTATGANGEEEGEGDENSARGLNPHAIPFNPGQAYPFYSDSTVQLTGRSAADSTTTPVAPSPCPSSQAVSESPKHEIKPPAYSPEDLEEFPPLRSPQMAEAVIPLPPPPQQTVLIRPQPPPPPPRVRTPPPPPAQPVVRTEVHHPAMVVPPMMRPPPRPNRQSPSPGGHRTPQHPMPQEPPPNMVINTPPMMPAPHSGPPSQASGAPHHSNGQPPQVIPHMMPHMSGPMHMMPQTMAHYPYPEMAGRGPVIYYHGHMAPVPGPPAPPGQQNVGNSEQHVPPPHMVYPPYYHPPMNYHVSSYGPPMMQPGYPQYVPVPPPMTPQRPGGGSRPRPQRRKHTSFFYSAPRRG